MMQKVNRFLSMAAQRQDILFIVFIMIFVSMFIIPVPVVVIDVLLAFNMTFTLLVLISATYLKNALELSTFPSIILFSTVFRLSLTVATARLILAQGDAGKIIDSFGKFVVSGNLVVGLVVFFIVAIVQFIVVVKGAERIAEVSARFTLDALPGKQMSIDSDLRAGDISKDEARRKRMTLEKESQFFGAMDGAMRFVKGDAIAGFVVIFVNLIGGVAVGMGIKGMAFGAAIEKYSLLSVGDGLVAQIPAMFVAIAAGTVVTRVSTDDSSNVGADMIRELGTQPKALAVAAVVMAIIAFLPGFPTILFLVLSAGLAAGAYFMNKAIDRKAAQAAGGGAEGSEEFSDLGQVVPLRPADRGDTFVVVAPPSLLQNLENSGGGNFLQDRKQMLQMELGMPLPDVGFRADPGLNPELWRLDVEDVPTFKSSYSPGRVKVLAPPQEVEALGISPTMTEDASGLPEVWISEEEAMPAVEAGLRMQPAADIFAETLIRQVRRYSSRAFGLGEAQSWLQMLEQRHGPLAQNVQQVVPPFKIVEVIRILLDEGVPLAQSRVILEAMLAGSEMSSRDLADRIRYALRRQIASQLADSQGNIRAVAIAPDVEGQLRAPNAFGFGNNALPDPAPTMQAVMQTLREIFMKYMASPPRLLICSADVRGMFQELVLDKNFNMTVLSTNDIPPGFQMQFLALVGLQGAIYAGEDASNTNEDEVENAS